MFYVAASVKPNEAQTLHARYETSCFIARGARSSRDMCYIILHTRIHANLLISCLRKNSGRINTLVFTTTAIYIKSSAEYRSFLIIPLVLAGTFGRRRGEFRLACPGTAATSAGGAIVGFAVGVTSGDAVFRCAALARSACFALNKATSCKAERVGLCSVKGQEFKNKENCTNKNNNETSFPSPKHQYPRHALRSMGWAHNYSSSTL